MSGLQYPRMLQHLHGSTGTQTPRQNSGHAGITDLIVKARKEYDGDGWLGYDICFHQNAAASPDICWSKIDPTLWNKAFVRQAKATRYKKCFCLTHAAEECDWAPTPSASKSMPHTQILDLILYTMSGITIPR